MERNSNNEKLPPEIIKKINHDQLQQLNATLHTNFSNGSPEQRKFAMQIRLAKKLNEKEYQKSQANKRKNPRFSS